MTASHHERMDDFITHAQMAEAFGTAVVMRCPACGHGTHEDDAPYCAGWSGWCDDCDGRHPCACACPDAENHAYLPDRLPPVPGLFDQWWPPSAPGDPPVSIVVLGMAHHHATGHLCSGGGAMFHCDGCDFAIDDGRVLVGGWVRFRSDDEPGS